MKEKSIDEEFCLSVVTKMTKRTKRTTTYETISRRLVDNTYSQPPLTSKDGGEGGSPSIAALYSITCSGVSFVWVDSFDASSDNVALDAMTSSSGTEVASLTNGVD